jgi:hypothetical protein
LNVSKKNTAGNPFASNASKICAYFQQIERHILQNPLINYNQAKLAVDSGNLTRFVHTLDHISNY